MRVSLFDCSIYEFKSYFDTTQALKNFEMLDITE